MLNLRSTRAVTYTPPPTRRERAAMAEIADLQAQGERPPDEEARLQELIAGCTVDEWRFTFAAMSVTQYGRYDANRRQAQAWLKATYTDLDSEEAGNAGIAAIRWAFTMAALVGLSTRQANRVADDAGAVAWAPLDIPDAWSTPAGYMDEVPADLAATLAEVAHEVNPGLFGAGLDMSTDAKKNGGISVM